MKIKKKTTKKKPKSAARRPPDRARIVADLDAEEIRAIKAERIALAPPAPSGLVNAFHRVTVPVGQRVVWELGLSPMERANNVKGERVLGYRFVPLKANEPDPLDQEQPPSPNAEQVGEQ